MPPDKLILSPNPSNHFFEWVRKSQDFIQFCPQTCLLLPEYEEIINENYCGTEKAYKVNIHYIAS